MSKVFFILFSFFTISFCAKNDTVHQYVQTIKWNVEKVIKYCASNPKASVIYKDLRGHFLNAGSYKDKTGKLLEPSKDTKCAFKCILQTLSLLDKSNNISPILSDVSLFTKEIDESFKGCISKISTTGCDKAYEFQKCIHKSMVDFFKHSYKKGDYKMNAVNDFTYVNNPDPIVFYTYV